MKTIRTSRVDLASQTETEPTELEPRDRIEVQSLIWVVGGYSNISDRPLP